MRAPSWRHLMQVDAESLELAENLDTSRCCTHEVGASRLSGFVLQMEFWGVSA